MTDEWDWCPPQDDRHAADQLSAERYETTLAAIYEAAMLGLSEPHLRTLCAETGIAWRDLTDYTPPILRAVKEQHPGQAELAPF